MLRLDRARGRDVPKIERRPEVRVVRVVRVSGGKQRGPLAAIG